MAEMNSIFENDELYNKLSAADDENAIREAFTGLDVYEESEELDEEVLDAVSGGYSRSWESTKIVAVTYYEMKRYGRARTYSDLEISEAITWVERNAKLFKKSVKMTVEEIKLGLKLSHGLGLI